MTISARGLVAAIAAMGLATVASAGATKARSVRLIGSPNGLPGLFTTKDYPADALSVWGQGTSKVEITITALGRVGNCVVVTSSGTESLDTATCRILTERSRYAPARDARGQPTSATATIAIRWQLPLDDVADDYGRAIVTIDRGTPGACHREPIKPERSACNSAERIVKVVLAWDNIPPAREAVFDFGQRIGTGVDLATLGIGPGLQRVDLTALTLTIAADGRIIDCRPTVGLADNEARATTCAQWAGRKFIPQPASVTALRYLTHFDVLHLRGVTTLPRQSNLAGLFGPDDYPADALVQSREGRVSAEVTVEANGRASACVVKNSSGTPSLDAVTCAKLLSQGKYEAARDPEQRAVRGTLIKRVAWALPRAPIDDRSTRAVFAMPGGKACVIEGHPSGDVDCAGARDSGSLALVSHDAKGKSALVVEYGQVIGTGESIERIGEGPGKSAWHMSAITLMVDAAGKLVECKPSFDWVGVNDAKEQCDVARADVFDPLEAGVTNRQPRALTRYETIYFRD